MYQVHYANAHGAKSFKSLPAMNKALAGIAFNLQYKYATPELARQWRAGLSQPGMTESDLSTAANDIWAHNGIGVVANEWKSMMKSAQPNPALASRP